MYQARGGAAPFPVDVISFLPVAGVFILVLVITFVASRHAGAGTHERLAGRHEDLRRWIVLTLGGAWLPALVLIHVLPLTGLAPEDKPKVLASAVTHIAIGIGLQALVAVTVVAVIHGRPAMRPWWIGLGVGALCYLGVGLGVLLAASGVGLGPSPFDVFFWPVLVGQAVGLLPTGD
jgi:hypothetical protein